MHTIRAITLHQPWASAIALGMKSYETRSWDCDTPGPVAIHAGKSVKPEYFELFSRDPFRSLFAAAPQKQWTHGAIQLRVYIEGGWTLTYCDSCISG